MEAGFFVDLTCPKCGRRIGNGGGGSTFRCECGYVGDGGLSEEDAKFLVEIYQRHLTRERELQDSE